MFGWGSLLTSVTDVIGKWLTLEEVKLLRKHSDEFLKLERALAFELSKNFDDMDDFAISNIKTQMKLVKEAYERDVTILGKTK